jgi:hypothetical protein
MSDFDYSDITTWYLGAGDCDSCGSDCVNRAEFDPQWGDNGEWSFSYDVGCYGGDLVSSTDDAVKERLAEMFAELRDAAPNHWNSEQEFEVLELIANLGSDSDTSD